MNPEQGAIHREDIDRHIKKLNHQFNVMLRNNLQYLSKHKLQPKQF